jgi:ferredoxin
MRVVVDMDKCQDHGQCAFEAPEVFQIDPETGKLVVLDESPDESQRDEVESAADVCPVQAITIED